MANCPIPIQVRVSFACTRRGRIRRTLRSPASSSRGSSRHWHNPDAGRGANSETCRDALGPFNNEELPTKVRSLAPEGIDHIVEVAFGANIECDLELLRMGGSIATHATNVESPTIPFWPLVFKNIQLFFLGSDDFPAEAKTAAAHDINAVLEAGWSGFAIGERIPLSEIARAHELAEHPQRPGRVVVML